MNFQDLHELLRLELLQRIERGLLTGTRLARQTGFQQAHISNFLNRKRALSLDGLDKVLASQDLAIDQLLPLDFAAAATQAQPSIESVPVVSMTTAMHEARIQSAATIENVPVAASRLLDSRPRLNPRQAKWQRFVAIHVDATQAAAMSPLLSPGAIAVIDRHYNSIAPYRAQQPNLYAIRHGSVLLLRHAEFDAGHLILRPTNLAYPVQLQAVAAGAPPSDYIIGRVCMLITEV